MPLLLLLLFFVTAVAVVIVAAAVVIAAAAVPSTYTVVVVAAATTVAVLSSDAVAPSVAIAPVSVAAVFAFSAPPLIFISINSGLPVPPPRGGVLALPLLLPVVPPPAERLPRPVPL